jgi:hypothetical protein
MHQPSEPLLPVEPETSSRKSVFLAAVIGVAALFGITVALVVVLRSGGAPAEPSIPAAPESSGTVPDKPRPGKPKPDEPRGGGEERRAKELYDKAEAFERSEPGEYEKRMAHWREVVKEFPTSSWARKADERYRAASSSLQTFLDREFESTRKDAQSLAAAGHFVDAVEAIQNYRSTQTRDVLKRRADVEIAAIENACRLSFNEASVRAKELAAKSDYSAALALFDALGRSAIPDVAAKCRKAVDQLQAAAAAHARHVESRKGEDVRRAFRQDVAPKILALVRARRAEG